MACFLRTFVRLGPFIVNMRLLDGSVAITAPSSTPFPMDEYQHADNHHHGTRQSMTNAGNNRLGLRFREAREARGISLAQASSETRIIQRYLAALENGEYHHLPGDVYARGFIRNYAQYLSLPADELIDLYRIERGASTPIQVVPAAVPPRRNTIFLPSLWTVILVVLALVVIGYLTLNALGLTTINSTQVAGAATSTSVIPTPTLLATPTAQPTNPDGSVPSPINPLATPTVTITPTQDVPVQVVLRIDGGSSWLQVLVDGQNTIEGIQSNGWTQPFSAQQTVQVKAGNAAVVEVIHNGKAPVRMGAPNQVVTTIYTPN